MIRRSILSLALYTLCWVMAPTESTLLGFFEAPFKEVFFGRKKAGIFPAKKIRLLWARPIRARKKIKKLEGQTGRIACPVCLCRLMQCTENPPHIEPASVKLATQQVQCDAR
jgi:hypothetical protein